MKKIFLFLSLVALSFMSVGSTTKSSGTPLETGKRFTIVRKWTGNLSNGNPVIVLLYLNNSTLAIENITVHYASDQCLQYLVSDWSGGPVSNNAGTYQTVNPIVVTLAIPSGVTATVTGTLVMGMLPDC
jgi:hypothetical protein